MDDEFIDAIQNLPPSLRTPYILRRIGGYKYAEIADILRWNMGTVARALRDARDKLSDQGFCSTIVLDDYDKRDRNEKH